MSSSLFEAVDDYFLAVSVSQRRLSLSKTNGWLVLHGALFLSPYFHSTLLYTCPSHVFAGSNLTVLRKKLRKY